MKKFWILIPLLIFTLSGCGNSNITKNNLSENNYINTNSNPSTNTENDVNIEKTSTQQNISNNTSSEENIKIETKPKEEKLSEFSTKIYDKTDERQKNVEITCSTLNEQIVKQGEEFSFTNVIGKATPNKGYEKAKIFDKQGNVEEGYGGGICQVSTTLYNAVKDISGITITERHDHSNTVPYAKKGNDAAVAHGSYDFKFVNNTNNDIIIHAESNEENVIITINKLIYE